MASAPERPVITILGFPPGEAARIATILRENGYRTMSVQTSVRELGLTEFQSGIAILNFTALRQQRPQPLRPQGADRIRIPVILVASSIDPQTAFQAARAGYAAILLRPLADSALLEAVSAMVAEHRLKSSDRHPNRSLIAGAVRPQSPEPPPVCAPARRVAKAILAVSSHSVDVPNLQAWARAIGTSRGTLRGWCQVLGVRASSALDLARAIRALRLGVEHRLEASVFLDFADLRSLHRFVARARLPEVTSSASRTLLADYCETQPLVTHPALSRELRQLYNRAVLRAGSFAGSDAE